MRIVSSTHITTATFSIQVRAQSAVGLQTITDRKERRPVIRMIKFG